MKPKKLDIYVYADWQGMQSPQPIGILSAHYAKGRKAFSFEYDATWIDSQPQRLIDPEINFYTGPQFPIRNENFGVFLDSMPDTWGRTLMRRKANQQALARNENPPTLYDTDFLLGILDEGRMGALRFKVDPDGPFLDNSSDMPTPPWSSIRELQYAANILENEHDNLEIRKWLAILMAPGSSLGGARPKANIQDQEKNLWIAKFPSKNDTINKGLWEYLAYKLAIESGISMSRCTAEKIAGKHHTFFTQRFDRNGRKRIHFASAMTMTGNSEDTIRDHPASYLDIVEFISSHCTQIEHNLKQLWTRIIFNIAISNTDDHLRNHGFILTNEGWILSPAYDLNPSIDKDGLALNIDMDNNMLDLDLAISVGQFFRLSDNEMHQIIGNVSDCVSKWRDVADHIGISRSEQELMKGAFRV